MNRVFSARIWLLLALVTVLAGGWWLSSKWGKPVTEQAPVAAESTAQQTAEPPDEDWGLEQDSLLQDSVLDAALIDPPTPSAETTPEAADEAQPLTAEQQVIRQQIEAEIETALAGDDFEAIALGNLLRECQVVPRSQQRITQSIAHAARSFTNGEPPKQFRPTGTPVQFESIEAFEDYQWNTFSRCQAARDLTNESFWERLVREADAGNPIARYLFAILPNNPALQGMGFDLWDEALQHSDQARHYTWRNLEDREPLGLLALAQTEGTISRYTAAAGSTRTVLLLAAVKCGLETPDLLQMVDQRLQQMQRVKLTHPNALEQLNTASDEAKRMFCK